MALMAKTCIIFGIVCVLYACLLAVSGILNASVPLWGVLGLFLLSLPKLYPLMMSYSQRGILRFIRLGATFLIGLIFLTCIITAGIIFQAGFHKPQSRPDAILVLGAAIHGDTISLTLQRRLDAAYEYSLQQPQAIFIVSGGQGPGENVTESSAMKQYLIEKGIEENRIFEEDQSTNTYENFYYSKEILDAFFTTDYTAVFVSNDFHIFRSGLIARGLHMEAEGLGAPSHLSLYPSHYIREIAAVLKYVLIGPGRL